MRQRIQIRQTAHLVGFGGAGQRFVDRHNVGGPGQRDQARYMLPDNAVVETIKIVFAQHIANSIPGGIVQQQAS